MACHGCNICEPELTADEALALVAKRRDAMREEISRLQTLLGDALRTIEEQRGEIAAQQSTPAVLRPLTTVEVKAALHEGRAEAMAATGDNAWTSLLEQRDSARAEAERMRGFADRMRLSLGLLTDDARCYCADLPAAIGGKCDYCTADDVIADYDAALSTPKEPTL